MRHILSLLALVVAHVGLVVPAPGARPARKAARGVAVSGYGVALRLRAPFKVKRAPSAKVADTLVATGPAGQEVLLVPGNEAAHAALKKERQGTPEAPSWCYRRGADGTAISLPAGMRDVAEVGKAEPGIAERAWYVSAGEYRFAWPRGYALVSAEAGEAWAFELEGPDGILVVFRGPLKGRAVSPPAKLIGEGQSLVGEGRFGDAKWIEVAYDEGGQPFRQRHYYGGVAPKGVVLVTVQGPQGRVAEMVRAAEAIVGSLAPL